MGQIKQLPPELINQIAAGEVIEAPHSILKELIENSLDAGATEIQIQTQGAGLTQIQILDNGKGMAKEDLPLAIQRHATSKIETFPDLERLGTFGFRGEALASIASVSKVEIESGVEGERTAYRLIATQGEITSVEICPHFVGTKITISDLFFNTPVRRKFLKFEASEDKKNRSRVQMAALSAPTVSFRYLQNGKETISINSEEPLERLLSLFGENLRNHLLPVLLERNGFRLRGWISHADFYKSARTGQYFFINGRSVELKFSAQILRKCYGELLPMGAHPYAFLFFELPLPFVDVNVHPQKKEVRFLSEETIISLLFEGIQSVLRSETPIEFLELRKRLSMPILGKRPDSLPAPSPFLGLEMLAQKREGFSLDGISPGNRLADLTDQPRTHSQFIPKKHYGVLFETFLLAEAEDGLYIIDQHTAHERIRYEEVLRDLKTKAYKTQSLLVPIRLELTKAEAEEILEKKAEFEKLGINIESFSGGTLLITEVPTYMDPGKEVETFLEYWGRIRSLPGEVLYDEMAKSVACRSAIKKGDQVSDLILAEMLQRLSYCENPSLCPHGRPTLIKLTRDDLEKMFHRK